MLIIKWKKEEASGAEHNLRLLAYQGNHPSMKLAAVDGPAAVTMDTGSCWYLQGCVQLAIKYPLVHIGEHRLSHNSHAYSPIGRINIWHADTYDRILDLCQGFDRLDVLAFGKWWSVSLSRNLREGRDYPICRVGSQPSGWKKPSPWGWCGDWWWCP